LVVGGNSDSGQSEIYLTTFPTPGRVWPVSGGQSGREIVWGKTSREIYFVRESGEIMVAGIDAAGQPAPPQSAGVGAFPANTIGPGAARYDVTADGRFILARPLDARDAVAPIIITINRPALSAPR
jgi:hypothetical protein